MHKLLALATSLALASGLAAQTLTTTMAGGTVLTPYPGSQTIYFDVNVTNPAGIFVSQIDVRCQLPTGFVLPGTMDVYRTAVGNNQQAQRGTPSAWRRVGTAPITAVGAPATGLLAQPFYLAPGTYGMGLHLINVQPVYTNGATIPPVTFSNADLTIDCTNGVAQNTLPTAPIGGGVSAAPRIAGITVTYSTTGHTTDFTVNPANGATPLAFTGPSPQLLTFTDESHTSDPGGLLPIWDWDFNGDGIVDQTTGVPTAQFNYTSCGTFDVRVTSYDLAGGVTTTKTAFVTMDPVIPSFTYTKIGNPAVFQFTDTSTGATGWQWDLDGVPGIDSTAQNPVFVYAAGCAPKTVTLTTTNACRTASTSRQVVAEPSIETLIVGTNNAGNAGGAVYFDCDVLNPFGIQICSFVVNANDAIGGTPIQVTWWEKTGTSVGFEATAAAWTNRGQVLAVAAKRDSETLITLPAPVYMTPGLHGFALQMTGDGQAYSNVPPGAINYANADVSLTLGSALNVAFSGAPLTPRVWSGRINYRTIPQGMSGYFKSGNGCAGSGGVVTQTVLNLPVIGQQFSVRFDNAVAALIPFYGFSNTFSTFLGAPLPFNMALLGMTPPAGCTLYIDPTSQGPTMVGAGSLTWNENVPNTVSIIGLPFFVQGLSIDAVNTFLSLPGAVLSDAATGVIGS